MVEPTAKQDDAVGRGPAQPQTASTPSVSPKPPQPTRSWISPLLVAVVIAALVGGAWFTRDAWQPIFASRFTSQKAERSAPEREARPPAETPAPATPLPPAATATSPVSPPTTLATPATPPEPAPSDTLPEIRSAQTRLSAQIETLVGRVEALEGQVRALDTAVEKLAATAGGTSDASLVTDRINQLEQVAAQLGSLEQKVLEVDRQASTARQGVIHSATAALAVMQLAQAVDAGVPFEKLLHTAQRAVAADPAASAALAALEPLAPRGVPTIAALQATFPGVADAVVRAAPEDAALTWHGRALAWLQSFVGIRVTGPAAAGAGGRNAVLAEAQASLAGGDLAAAVAQLETLQGPARAAAAAWLDQARARLTADQALRTLQQQALSRLSAETE